MKVALAFPGCHRRGGVERVMFECANFLSGRGHDVTVFANEWEDVGRVRIHYKEVAGLRHPWFIRGAEFYRRSSRLLQQNQFDVLNTHGCVCPTGGVHWVQSLHKAWLERCRQFRKFASWPRIRQRLNPLHPILIRYERRHFAERRYKKIIATTSQVRDDLALHYGVPHEDVVIIPNGFSEAEFNSSRRTERRSLSRSKLGLRDDDKVLLFAANELERKGYPTLLGAIRILEDPRLKIIVVGRPSRERVLLMARELGVERNVLACGHATDIAMFHAAADVFVLPTQYEAFCLAILEALGSGLPVITSNVPGAADAILSGENGLLIQDPQDEEELAVAIQSMFKDDRHSEMSKVTSDTVKKYRWSHVLLSYEQVLLNACSEGIAV